MPPKSGSRVGYEHANAHGGKMPPPGEGSRFKALEGKLAKEPGVRNPGAVAASIGREKYGEKKMANWAKKGRKG